MENKIYKSFIPGISNDQFELNSNSGMCSFVSFERLKTQSIEQAVGLKFNEFIKGIVIDECGIKVCIVKV